MMGPAGAWGVRTDSRLLRLRAISPDKKGLYTCVASNAEGDGQSNAVNINVECEYSYTSFIYSIEGFGDVCLIVPPSP